MKSDSKHTGLIVMFCVSILTILLFDVEVSLRFITAGVELFIGQVYDWLVSYPRYTKYLKEKENEEALQKRQEIQYKKAYNIPENVNIVKCISSGAIQGLSKINIYIWSDRSYLYLMSTDYKDKNNKKFIIPISNIKYYTITGEIFNEVDVHSNISGGGSSIKGALVGGALAGSTGAIIGSRKPVKATIETRNIRVDERETILMVSYNGTVTRMIFSPHTYKILEELIPAKSKDYILLTR